MKDRGLFAFCGVPGSGKTLNTVNMALKHYKKENSPIKFYTALFKYKLLKNKKFNKFLVFIDKINFIKKIKEKYNNWCDKHNEKVDKVLKIVLKILLFILKILFRFILLLFLIFEKNNYIRIMIILFFIRKSIYRWFNSLDYEYFCLFPYKKINNIYSSFPILLDKKKGIYSHKVSLWDLNNLYSFLPDSLIIIDEIQLFVDSDEYKEKQVIDILRKIGNYFQAHRHYGIKNIIVTSQGVTRIFKKCRDVCSGYLKLNKVFKLPFIPYGFISGTFYYDIDYYGKYIPRNKEERRKLPFDYKKYRCITNLEKIYTSYDSRYLANLNYSKPLLNKGEFTSLKSSKDDLKEIFKAPKNIASIVDEEEKKDNKEVKSEKKENFNKFFSK